MGKGRPTCIIDFQVSHAINRIKLIVVILTQQSQIIRERLQELLMPVAYKLIEGGIILKK